jgi:hypothetical protein
MLLPFDLAPIGYGRMVDVLLLLGIACLAQQRKSFLPARTDLSGSVVSTIFLQLVVFILGMVSFVINLHFWMCPLLDCVLVICLVQIGWCIIQ